MPVALQQGFFILTGLDNCDVTFVMNAVLHMYEVQLCKRWKTEYI